MNTTKAPRITVNSTLFAELPKLTEGEIKHSKEVLDAHIQEQGKILATLLIGKGTEAHKLANQVWKQAIKVLPEMEKEILEKEEAKRLEAEKAKAEQIKAQEEAKKIMFEQQDKLVEFYTQNGMDLEIAKKVVQDQLGVVSGRPVIERVTVKVGDEVLDMPIKGNQSKRVKELLNETGLDVDAFIKQYQVQEANA